jgi:hypothetical protein
VQTLVLPELKDWFEVCFNDGRSPLSILRLIGGNACRGLSTGQRRCPFQWEDDGLYILHKRRGCDIQGPISTAGDVDGIANDSILGLLSDPGLGRGRGGKEETNKESKEDRRGNIRWVGWVRTAERTKRSWCSLDL